MIKEYKIITIIDEWSLLQEMVNELIVVGWEPLGGVSVATWEADDYSTKTEYVQAMIRRE